MTEQRTIRQNKALHKWLTLWADAANDAGFDQKAILEDFKEGFEVPTTMEFWKGVFRAAGKAMYGIESTSDLTTKQMIELAEIFTARVSENTGIIVDWPSIESLMDRSDAKD